MHTICQNDLALDHDTWLDRVRRFMRALGDDTVTVDRHLRKAHHLQCLAPGKFKRLMVPAIEECQLEALLERNAYGTATEHITGVTVQSLVPVAAAIDQDSPMNASEENDVHSVVAALAAWAVSFLRPDAKLN